MPRRALLVFGLTGLLNSGACGQGDAVDIRRGKELAERLCSSCHLAVSDQQNAASDAPSLQSMADGQRADAESLRAFFNATQSNVAHTGAMPNPRLRNEEIDKISAYIRSLAKP